MHIHNHKLYCKFITYGGSQAKFVITFYNNKLFNDNFIAFDKYILVKDWENAKQKLHNQHVIYKRNDIVLIQEHIVFRINIFVKMLTLLFRNGILKIKNDE